MKFTNALSGVKKLRASELLNVLCAVLLIVGVLLMTFGSGNAGAEGYGTGPVILVIAAGAIALLAMVLQLIGLYQAGKDEKNFTTAFWFVIISIIVTIATGIFSGINSGKGLGDNNSLDVISRIVTNFSGIIVIVLTINGVRELAVKLVDTEMGDRGQRIFNIIIVMEIIIILANLSSLFLGMTENDVILIVSGVLAMLALFIEILVYFMFIGYLGKAKKMLEK